MKYTDEQLVELVNERFRSATNGRNSCRDANNNITAYLNNSVTVGNGAKKPSALNVNLAWVAIENLASLMSDTPVSINVTHKHPETELDAKVYQASIDWVLEQNRINRKRESEQKYSMLKGTGIFSCCVEKDRDGKNFIKIDSEDPSHYVLDPFAKSPDAILYRIKTAYYPKHELKKLYPKWKDDGTNTLASNEGTAQLMSEIDIFNETEKDTPNELVAVREMIWFCEGEEYEFGRKTVATENALLEDGPFEYSSGIPDAFVPCVSMPDRIFGVDLYRYIKPITDELNIIWKRLSIMIKKCANPQKLVSALAGIDTDNITNADGQVHIVRNVMDVRGTMQWEQPVQITESIYAFVEKLQQLFQIVSGMTDMSIGYASIQSSMPSGISLERLQQASQTRLRQMVRNRNDGFVDLGKILACLIHQYMDEEQVIKITGMQAEIIKKVMEREKFNVAGQALASGAKSPDEIQQAVDLYDEAKGIKMKRATNNETYLSFVGSKLEDPTKFDISVTAGLDVPKSKIDIMQVVEKLFPQFIDLETLLDTLEIPQKESILSRSPIWQEFKGFQQMKQQQMNAEIGRGNVQQGQGPVQQGQPVPESIPVPESVPNTPDVSGGQSG